MTQRIGTVLITGAAGSLGSAVSEKFKSQNWTVLRVDRTGELPCDLTRPDEVKKLFKSLTRLDVVIHCAGGFRFTAFADMKDEDLDFLLNFNLKSSLLIAREALPLLKQSSYGRMLFIGAKAASQAGFGMGLYAATKLGIQSIVQSLTEECKELRVNAVLPSILDTPPNRKDMPDADFKKWVKCSEVADILYWLTQPESDPIRGAMLPIAGGV